jgi:tol-pal system protein YbgF
MTGLALMAGPVSFSASAQDYIDVESERSQRPAVPAGATSYGTANAPQASAPPAGTDSSANVGNLLYQVQQLRQEVMRLNGIVEEQGYELRRLKEQNLERYMDLDRRLAGGASASSPATAGGSASGGANNPEVMAPQPGREAAELPGEGDAYRAAYALVRGQEFDAAVSAFRSFLQEYPAGRYAPNAHYWLGELYLVLDPPDPEASRQAFMLLLTQYPDNAKIPDALYKLGRVHFMKGSRDKSREFLQRVLREYPDSSAARLAQDFIDQNL